MGQHNKKLILITILVSVLALTGCKNVRFHTINEAGESDTINTQEQQNEISDEGDEGKKDNQDTGKQVDKKEQKSDKEEPTPTIIQPVENTELTVYIVNSDAELENVTALIPKDTQITPQLIVDTVKDSMADNSLNLGIESVEAKDDAVIVSFYANQPPVTNVGASYEVAILDAIAQSLVDNLTDYNKVIYRIEGKAYEGGHVELGIDEVYLEK
jgi:uncharacterized protein YceK